MLAAREPRAWNSAEYPIFRTHHVVKGPGGDRCRSTKETGASPETPVKRSPSDWLIRTSAILLRKIQRYCIYPLWAACGFSVRRDLFVTRCSSEPGGARALERHGPDACGFLCLRRLRAAWYGQQTFSTGAPTGVWGLRCLPAVLDARLPVTALDRACRSLKKERGASTETPLNRPTSNGVMLASAIILRKIQRYYVYLSWEGFGFSIEGDRLVTWHARSAEEFT